MSELGLYGYYGQQVQLQRDGNEVPLDLGVMMEEAELDVRVDSIIESQPLASFDLDWIVHKGALTMVALLSLLFFASSGIRVV